MKPPNSPASRGQTLWPVFIVIAVIAGLIFACSQVKNIHDDGLEMGSIDIVSTHITIQADKNADYAVTLSASGLERLNNWMSSHSGPIIVVYGNKSIGTIDPLDAKNTNTIHFIEPATKASVDRYRIGK